jgi:methionine-rich copper-binding protein CopC
VEILVTPAGSFALGRTRTLDGNGHPLGGVAVSQSGPGGNSTLTSDPESGFLSLGGGAGEHTWAFSKTSYLTTYRKANLVAGSVRVVPFPWMAPLHSQQTELSVLNPTTVASPSGDVSLVFPTGAFDQVISVALTDLHGQSLPLPLPHGWSPLAAFHLEMPKNSAESIASTIRLLQTLPTGTVAFLARCDVDSMTWITEATLSGNDSETVSASIQKPGSYAVVLADSLPSGNPALAAVGAALPAGGPPMVAPDVTAVGTVNPATQLASLDPAKVTAEAKVDFTNGSQALPSGAWFLADVAETYDLRDGQALKTPDYDATFYAYQHPGDSEAPTASARFPMRPRLLFGPDQLDEAHIKVDVRAVQVVSGAVLTSEGGVLTLPGIRLKVPSLATTLPVAAEIRPITIAGLDRFLGGFKGLLAFDLNIPTLPGGMMLEQTFTETYTPNSHFVLSRCVSNGAVSGLQPVLRLTSNAEGKLSLNEPSTDPRLSGITGSGQYVLVPITEPEALVTGVVRALGGNPLAGAVVRVNDEPWLSLTRAAGTFSTLAKPGTRIVTGSNPTDGNSGEATATLTDAASHDEVEIQTAPTGPKIIATTPAAAAQRASLVNPITIEFSEPIQPGSFAANGIRLRDLAANQDVPGTATLELSNRRASFFPTNPLVFATDYQIIVTNAIRDLQNLPIEGPLTFNFKTQPSDARPAGAQLVIYEPDAKNIPQAILDQLVGYDPDSKLSMVVATGSPGTADPEVPVILVNESSGETATVLSKPDGSFSSYLNASEEDLINGVFVNLNGTRISVPVTRQLYDDGRVGLYQQGGMLQASNEEVGTVQIIVAPGAVQNRNVFSIARLGLADVLNHFSGVPPSDEARLVGGVDLKMEGPPLKEGADISISASVESLGLPPGADPAHASFALARPFQTNGVTLYDVIDKVEYRGGSLTTASPPFTGAVTGMPVGFLLLANGGKAVTTGRAVAKRQGSTGTEEKGVPSAIISYHRVGRGQLSNGEIVTVADESGGFRLIAPMEHFDLLGSTDTLLLRGLSGHYPGVIGTGSASIIPSLNLAAAVGKVTFFFNDSEPDVLDTSPPTVSAVLVNPESPPQPGQQFTILVRGADDKSPPSLALTSNAFHTRVDRATKGTETLELWNVLSPAGRARITVTASDAHPRSTTAEFVFDVGASALPSPLAVDDSDDQPPYVIHSNPVANDTAADFRQPINLVFNEPIDTRELRDLVNGAILTPSAGVPYVQVSLDNRRISLRYPTLQPGRSYSLVLSPRHYRDLAGNEHDQDKINMRYDLTKTPLILHFQTLGTNSTNDFVINDGSGIAATSFGTALFAIDRSPDPKIKYFTANANGGYVFADEESLSVMPRDLVAVSGFDLVLPDPEEHFNEEQLLNNSTTVLVSGGQIGAFTEAGWQGQGPWLSLLTTTQDGKIRRGFLKSFPEFGPTLFLKLAIDRGTVGVLASSVDSTTVHLLNLQTLAWNCDPRYGRVLERSKFSPGIDLNGDGDYGDRPGEFIPSVPTSPKLGFINRGEISAMASVSGERIQDFALANGGGFVCAVTNEPTVGVSRLRILRDSGRSVDQSAPASFVVTSPGAKRVFALFGVNTVVNGSAIFADFLFVSAGDKLEVYRYNGASAKPSLATTITFRAGAGAVQSVQPVMQAFGRPANGLLAVATVEDMFYLDPTRLLDAQQEEAHPAISGLAAGFGSNARAFFALSNGVTGISSGARSRISAGLKEIAFEVESIYLEDVNQAEEEETGFFRSSVPSQTTPPQVRQSQRNRAGIPMLEVVVEKEEETEGLDAFRDSLIESASERLLGEGLNSVREQIQALRDAKAKVTGYAKVIPEGATPEASFPAWNLPETTSGTGPAIPIEMAYLPPNLGAAFNMFRGARVHREVLIGCADKQAILKIYPDIEASHDLDLSGVLQKVNSVLGLATDVVNSSQAGLLSGRIEAKFAGGDRDESDVTDVQEDEDEEEEEEEEGEEEDDGGHKISFKGKFVECPDSNQVLFAPSVTVTIDPLIELTGRLQLGPVMPGLSAGVFAELTGKIGVEGTIERLVEARRFGEWKSTMKLPSSATLALGVDLTARAGITTISPTISGELRLEGSILIDSAITVQPTTNDEFRVDLEIGAKFTGIKGKGKYKIYTFIGETEGEGDVGNLVGPSSLIDPPEKILLDTFKF